MINKLFRRYINFRGWHTSKKIVVIESDDWGTIRMPDRDSFERIVSANPAVKNDPYSRYDSFASKEDLEHLFEVLTAHKDRKGHAPVITANTIVANPDFEKIESSEYKTYYYEPFHETILRYPEGKDVIGIWTKCIEKKIVVPQLHGREHLHVPLWLEELRNGNKDLQMAFKERCFGIPYHATIRNRRKNLLAALDQAGTEGEQRFQESSIKEAVDIFSDYFKFSPTSFIAPAYTWHSSLEKKMFDSGILNIQGLPLQYQPAIKNDSYKKIIHFTGQENKYGQVFTIRNAFFEPSLNSKFDWVNDCLLRIKESFAFRKPVIISSHRVNFIGRLDVQNRVRNLHLFDELLRRIVKNWPDVEFASSDQLTRMISQQ